MFTRLLNQQLCVPFEDPEKQRGDIRELFLNQASDDFEGGAKRSSAIMCIDHNTTADYGSVRDVANEGCGDTCLPNPSDPTGNAIGWFVGLFF